MAWINILETFYPVGSIYISTVSTSPANFIGGTWTAISGAVIRGIGPEDDSVGYIGADTHVLSVTELPVHSHSWFTAVNGTQKPYSANVVSGAGYAWTNVFTGADTIDSSVTGKMDNTSGSQLVGEDKPHTNIQRSYNCYIWYRTA